MSLLFMEGFDAWKTQDYGSTPAFLPLTAWDAIVVSTFDPLHRSGIGTGRNSGKCYQAGDNACLFKAVASHSTAIVGFAFDPSGNASGYGGGFGLTGYTANGCRFHVLACMDLARQSWRIYRPAQTVNYCNASLASIVANSTYTDIAATGCYGSSGWSFMEFKIVLGTPGSVTIRCNGAEVATAVSMDTAYASTYAAQAYTGIVFPNLYPGNSIYGKYDDLYLLSGDSTSPNGFLGDSGVASIAPNGAGTYSEFPTLTGAASHYQAVDDADGNDSDADATRVASAVSGHRDTFAMSSLSMTGNIIGIQAEITARKTDSSGKLAIPMLRLGSTDLDLEPVPAFDGYRTQAQATTARPGGGAYLAADIDALELGIKVG